MFDATNPPDGAQNTEQGQHETAIPYARFKEVNDAKKQLEARLAAVEQAQKEAQEKQLADQQQWKQLYEQAKAELETLKPYKSQVDEVRQALKETVEAEVATLPEDARGLVPEYDDPRKTLAWLNANKTKLVRPPAPGTDPGKQGEQGTTNTVKLSPDEEDVIRKTGISREKYIARKLQLGG